MRMLGNFCGFLTLSQSVSMVVLRLFGPVLTACVLVVGSHAYGASPSGGPVAFPPSARNGSAKCGLLDDRSDLKLGPSKGKRSVIGFGHYTFDLKIPEDRDALETLLYDCGVDSSDSRWSKSPIKSLEVLEQASDYASDVVRSDREWMAKAAAQCSDESTLTSCMSVSEGASRFPEWLRSEKYLALAQAGRTHALQIAGTNAVDANYQCVADSSGSASQYDIGAIDRAQASCDRAASAINKFADVAERLQASPEDVPSLAQLRQEIESLVPSLERLGRRKDFLNALTFCKMDGEQAICDLAESLEYVGTVDEVGVARKARADRLGRDREAARARAAAEQAAAQSAAAAQVKRAELYRQWAGTVWFCAGGSYTFHATKDGGLVVASEALRMNGLDPYDRCTIYQNGAQAECGRPTEHLARGFVVNSSGVGSVYITYDEDSGYNGINLGSFKVDPSSGKRCRITR